ncbi:sensor histidine kinase [Halarcobacter ebronensis]|uniref:histidine kinase n=1 Tax=Halarcobacter ebronensis TaxID=1462615 RepID=A0A4Q1AP28_9BACT|nr:sensor histidine kinase [Halarcobacter ebronensis]QKF80531.1 7TMR-DISM-7TM domain-containing two-component system sensor histidine kinase [Halarcobacter ebronensis]RXK08339.1 histidine kinase [Halarcobacter ebronensis]
MLRIILFIFLILINLDATTIKDSLFGSKFISYDGITFEPFENSNYKNIQTNKDITFKININKKILNNEIFYIKIFCKPDIFVSSNLKYRLNDDYPLIKIDKDINEPLILVFKANNNLPKFYIKIYNELEYNYILKNEKIFFGISYGILLCAFLYNLVFYLSNKKRAFLYYSILQLLLFFLLLIMYKEMFIFSCITTVNEKIIDSSISILINFILFFSILFNLEFLDTKKYTPSIHKALKVLALIIIINSFMILFSQSLNIFEYISLHYVILILIFSAFVVLKRGNKTAIIYLIGWALLFSIVFFSETNFFEMNDLYLLHIGIPLESLIFSLALGLKIRQIELEKQQNETLLINQSKLASMGEMIGNIAHQWRQPLTHLSYIIMNIKAAYDNNKLNNEYISKKSEEANRQIEFMSQTIDDFRNFFKTSKLQSDFSLIECIKENIRLLNESFKVLDIEIKLFYKKDFQINTYKGQLSQVIFNLLNNAKDEFIKNKTINPKIVIELSKTDKYFIIKIIDNAGGIEEKILKKIFEPYFTTKESGLGIGLYMSKIIIEKNMKGKLEVVNRKDGAEFIISLLTSK